MATKLFIDTWGWLTLHNRSERYHQEATEAYQGAIAQNCYASNSGRSFTAVFMYLNHICRKGLALLNPYRVVYLPENSCKSLLI